MKINSVITGTGSYIPTLVKKNFDFLNDTFLNEDGTPFEYENAIVIDKFKSITGIEERRYATPELTSSDLGFFAADRAILDAGIDKETIDYIILAHNFGDVKSNSIQSDILPSLASRVKQRLGIKNPNCVAYDILFGCPGWIQGVIQAEAYIKSGMAKKCLVIGTETLSRVIDPFDRDSMIYSDGAGACIVEAVEGDLETGILSHAAQTNTVDECFYLFYGKSYNKEDKSNIRYIKMFGRKIYEYGLNHVPLAMKTALDKSGVSIDDVKKIFIHQANEKMDEAILKRFYRLYKKAVPKDVMPMSIHKLGNSSVATVPTLFDLVKQGKIENQEINNGDIVILASVGAGMNINAVVYRY
ncbi:3-oxoacyl-ACP synthase III family protein [Lutibacter maritimus]|uniref:3-oxoacyl-[acyl-carrier-protein] synthase-3 n=1 Tax=Lutibacter maritimus TaxID=593133 RepID=A0A1I6S4Q6_9FLAO|nr:3-oxoacyl-ACP synthase III family protein [Lutibacter maritimus]SFS71748.1 3-oxoacyl-[acyl-carrier-protein] synthase-3 [Lutibacter maritimus]